MVRILTPTRLLRRVNHPRDGGLLGSRGAVDTWDPLQPTTDGGVSAHTIHDPESGEVYTDSAETTLVSSDGDVVGSSVNQGTDDHSITQGTEADKPKWRTDVLNGHAVFELDGAGDFLQGAFDVALSQPETFFIVLQMEATKVNDGNFSRAVDGDDVDHRFGVLKNANADPDEWSIQAGDVLSSGVAVSSDWTIIAGLHSGVASKVWVNGGSAETGDSGPDDPDGITLGGTWGDANHWHGYIAYVVIYDSDLSTADMNQVGNFLADRFGLSWTNL